MDIYGFRAVLERLAEQEEASLNVLVRRFIREALQARGILLEPIEDETEAIDFLLTILSGRRPDDEQIVELAHILDTEEEALMALRDKLFPPPPPPSSDGEKKPNGNGKPNGTGIKR